MLSYLGLIKSFLIKHTVPFPCRISIPGLHVALQELGFNQLLHDYGWAVLGINEEALFQFFAGILPVPTEVETESLQVLKFPRLEVGALSVQSKLENVCAMLEEL